MVKSMDSKLNQHVHDVVTALTSKENIYLVVAQLKVRSSQRILFACILLGCKCACYGSTKRRWRIRTRMGFPPEHYNIERRHIQHPRSNPPVIHSENIQTPYVTIHRSVVSFFWSQAIDAWKVLLIFRSLLRQRHLLHRHANIERKPVNCCRRQKEDSAAIRWQSGQTPKRGRSAKCYEVLRLPRKVTLQLQILCLEPEMHSTLL